MNPFVVWMDHEQAKFFELAPGGVQKDQLERAKHLHHSSSEEKHNGESKFFHELAVYLDKRAKEVLLMGPGTAKDQFVNHLKSHNHSALASKVVGVCASDHPSDNMILKEARKFFVHYDAFH